MTGTPESLDVAVTAVEPGARRWPASASCPASRGRTSSAGAGGTSRSRACSTQLHEAGLDAIADLPLDAIADPPPSSSDSWPRAIGQLRLHDRQGAGRPSASPCCSRAAELQERFGCIQVDQPAAARAQRVPSDHRLRRREDGGDREAGGAEHPDGAGGLAALRPEARAGGADVRRRRSRRRDRRPTTRPMAGGARRSRRFGATSRRPASSPSNATAASPCVA